MNATLPEDWRPALSKLRRACQPIVSLSDRGA